MKKMISVLSVLFVLFLSTSCQKDPDMSKLDDNFMVYTDYDKKENFSEFSTYYIPDSILLISDSKEAKYWKDDNALNIIDTYVKNMERLHKGRGKRRCRFGYSGKLCRGFVLFYGL